VSDLLPLTIFAIIVVDPFVAAVAASTLAAERAAPDRSVMIGAALATSVLAFALAILVGDPLLDWLDISSPSASLAAGMVVAVAALFLLVFGAGGNVRPADNASPARVGVFPLGVPVVVSPAAVASLIAWSAVHGPGVTAVAAALALVVVALSLVPRVRVNRTTARVGGAFMGVALAFVAWDLIHDGVFGI
jgi:multiple antibiotic resistance protein